MKTTLSIAFFATAVFSSAADDRFLGGDYDGSATGNYTGYTPPVLGGEPRFTGGVGGFDGYASGAFEGYSPPVPGDSPRFTGSGAGFDGYASGYVEGYTAPGPGDDGRFAGGGGFDGYSAGVYEGYVAPLPGEFSRFTGSDSGYDGFASAEGLGLTNPLAGDSDGDGVPDWWESGHYLSLTLADADTDLDGDRMGSLAEYLADTDPGDAASRFAVTAFSREGGNIEVISATTSAARVYWVEAAEDLESGVWEEATSPAVTGTGGELELSFEDDWSDQAFFRVRVGLPE